MRAPGRVTPSSHFDPPLRLPAHAQAMPGNSSPGRSAPLLFLRARAQHFWARWAKAVRHRQAGPSDEAIQRSTFVAPAILSRLPAEVLFLILDSLSLSDKVALAQTCRDFQHIIFKVPYHDDSNLRQRHKPGISMREFITPDEQMEYLCHATRVRPDSWACHVCVAAHGGASFKDIPGPKTDRNQMDHPCQGLRPSRGRHFHCLGPYCRMLPAKHYHVQLLFKSIRRWETIDKARRQYAKNVFSSFAYELPAEGLHHSRHLLDPTQDGHDTKRGLGMPRAEASYEKRSHVQGITEPRGHLKLLRVSPHCIQGWTWAVSGEPPVEGDGAS